MRLLAPLLLIACSDYEVHADNDAVGAGAPDIRVTPEALSVQACGDEAIGGVEQVTVQNVGGAPLSVLSVTVEGPSAGLDSAWDLTSAVEPFTLDPQAAQLLSLVPGPGDGALWIGSDDPDAPWVEVPLRATSDGPPAVEITTPDPDAVFIAGQRVALEGLVSDDLDAPDQLDLAWSSDVDGAIATAPAGADGVAEAEWAYAGRSVGEHQLSLTATDACGNTATAEIPVCQQAGYTSDELDIASWHVEGVAYWDEAEQRIQLTGADVNVVGTAFAIDQEVSGAAVSIRFNFYIGGGTGADGISLTALDTERMTTFLGGAGCGLGYGGDASCTDGPALPGWSIEVDTYFNDGQDPTADDHLMFTFDGDVDDPAAWAALPEMEDTGWHTLEVTVDAPWVTVSVDDVIYIDQELSGAFDFPAYVGFTAGTGGDTNYHWIESLEVTDFVCGD